MKSFLIIIGLCISTLSFGNTPATYLTFATARKASIAEKKMMAIFFVSSNSSSSQAAWEAFLKNPAASDKITLKLDINDFDGRVIFETYGPAKAPGFTLLMPDGTIKDKWEGNWDKSPINEPVSNTKPTLATASQNVSSLISPENSTPKAEPANPAPPMVSGKVVQAGYFGSEANAQKLVSDLNSKGFDGFRVVTLVNDGKTFYRVVSQVVKSEADASTMVQKLKAVGINGSVKEGV